MKWWQSTLVLALLVMPAAALAQEAEVMAAEDMAADEVRAQIEAADAEFAAIMNGDDPAAAAAQYAADAVMMPPGMEAVEGVDGIRGFLADGMGGNQLSLETWDVEDVGDAVISTGGYVITGPDGAHVDHGKYLIAWTPSDDGLKISYEMWNSSMPQAPRGEGAMREMHEKMHGEGEGMMEKAEGAMEEAEGAMEDAENEDDAED